MLKLIRDNLASIIATTICIVILVFGFVNCTSPEPRIVEGPTLEQQPPKAEGEQPAYKVTITVENGRNSFGGVQLIMRLRERGSGRTVAEQNGNIYLEGGEQEEVSYVFADVEPGDYVPEVRVEYPVR